MIQDSAVQTLIIDTAVGDQNAFEKLYQLTSPILFNIAMKLLNNRPLAEEALQESFISIWYKANDFDADKGYAFAWLATIVRRKAIDLLRQEGRKAPEIQIEDFSDYLDTNLSDQPHHEEADHLAVALMKKCLEQLNEWQRKSLFLSYFHGYSHQELVEHLAKPLGSIKSWIRRGMNDIRECMK